MPSVISRFIFIYKICPEIQSHDTISCSVLLGKIDLSFIVKLGKDHLKIILCRSADLTGYLQAWFSSTRQQFRHGRQLAMILLHKHLIFNRCSWAGTALTCKMLLPPTFGTSGSFRCGIRIPIRQGLFFPLIILLLTPASHTLCTAIVQHTAIDSHLIFTLPWKNSEHKQRRLILVIPSSPCFRRGEGGLV